MRASNTKPPIFMAQSLHLSTSLLMPVIEILGAGASERISMSMLVDRDKNAEDESFAALRSIVDDNKDLEQLERLIGRLNLFEVL